MGLMYKNLEDIPPPRMIYNGPLDVNISGLVRVLGLYQITTIGSCEGHLQKGKTHYPWVQFLSSNNTLLIDFLLGEYNKKDRAFWHFQNNSIRTKYEAESKEGLSDLHRSAGGLAEFLFDYRPEKLDPTADFGIYSCLIPFNEKQIAHFIESAKKRLVNLPV